ncbi:MAG: ATP-binding protein [Nannocystaceae bacterium]|nr:ATP-binding protein [bacterium]
MVETRHSPAFTALPLPAFVADPAGTVLHVSEAWTNTLGIPIAASEGKTLWSCIGGELGALARERWPACVDGAERLEIEGPADPPHAKPPPGDRRWRVEAHRAPSGDIVGVVRDITPRWQRTQMQRRLLAWSRKLQQASTFGELVDLAEAEAREVTRYRAFWLFVRPSPDSPVARRLASSGSAAEAQWEHLPEIVIADDAMATEVVESDHTVIVEDARTDPRTNKETVAQLGSRTIINVPLNFLDQNIGAFGMGSFGDEGVMMPTPLELEVVETMAQHIGVAAGRLRFLAERRIAEQDRQALELRMLRLENLDSLGVLAGGVAHDVNNLMTVILGNLDLAKRDVAEGSEAAEALEHVHVAAMRTTHLAEQMLAYAGQGAVRQEIGDLHTIASETLTLARVSVPPRTLLELRGDTGSLVTGDLTQLRQLLMNLVKNAGEAIGPDRDGQVCITVDRTHLGEEDLAGNLLHDAPPGEYVVLEVTDDGSGMDDETVARLFAPFFTTKATGRGLGMAAALGIVRGHRGALWVDSTPGRGTTFRVALPAARPSQVETEAPARGRVVLVADDEATIRKISRLTLERAGFEVVEAEDGRRAIEVFEQHRDRIGVVLLDSLMPRMSGSEVLQEIRARRPGFPVVLSSGFLNAPETGPEHPTAMLPKPWKPKDLVDLVRSLLGDASAD